MCYFVKAGSGGWSAGDFIAFMSGAPMKAKGAGESIATEGPAAGAAGMLILDLLRYCRRVSRGSVLGWDINI